MTQEFVQIIIFCLVTGGGLMINAISRRKKTRKIADTPRSKVASAPQGYVELQGFAWPSAGHCVRSTSGEEVVFYSLLVQRSEMQGSGKNRRRKWVTVFSHSQTHPFYLVDATGLALVATSAAEFDLEKPRIRKWSSLTAEERKRIEELPGFRLKPDASLLSRLFVLFTVPYRIVECEIGVGCPLYLHGDFRTPSAELPRVKLAGLSEFASRVFNADARNTKNIGHFLDKNRDGLVSAEESRLGYGFAGRQARNKSKIQSVEEREFEVCGNVGSSPEHKLLIADTHEEHLLKRRERWVWLQFVGGAALLAIGSTALFVQLL